MRRMSMWDPMSLAHGAMFDAIRGKAGDPELDCSVICTTLKHCRSLWSHDIFMVDVYPYGVRLSNIHPISLGIGSGQSPCAPAVYVPPHRTCRRTYTHTAAGAAHHTPSPIHPRFTTSRSRTIGCLAQSRSIKFTGAKGEGFKAPEPTSWLMTSMMAGHYQLYLIGNLSHLQTELFSPFRAS
jgi:hypothetical protein